MTIELNYSDITDLTAKAIKALENTTERGFVNAHVKRYNIDFSVQCYVTEKTISVEDIEVWGLFKEHITLMLGGRRIDSKEYPRKSA